MLPSSAAAPRLELRATWVGEEARSRLDAGGRGQVHSAYEEALNLAMQKGLVCLVSSKKGRGPLNVVAEVGKFNLLREASERGSSVSLQGGWLCIGGGLLVDLNGAALYEPAAKFRRPPASRDVIRRNAREAERLILSSGRLEGLGALLCHLPHDNAPGGVYQSPFVARARPYVEKLAGCLLCGDLQRAVQAARGLTGLGVGLTPSGDDLLSGVLVTLILGSKNGVKAPPRFQSAAHAIALASGGRTTLLSSEYMMQASMGKANESVVRFAEAIYTGSLDELRKSLLVLLEYGATSGTDIATGVTIGALIALGEQVFAS